MAAEYRSEMFSEFSIKALVLASNEVILLDSCRHYAFWRGDTPKACSPRISSIDLHVNVSEVRAMKWWILELFRLRIKILILLIIEGQRK